MIWRRLGIGARVALVSIAFIALAGLAIERISAGELEASLVARTESDLTDRLGLLEDAARELSRTSGSKVGVAGWDGLADRLGKSGGARVTLIAPDGRVVGDSEVPLEELGRLANHADRPEVVGALTRGTASSQRRSPTLGERMIYVARRYPAPEHGVAVIRVAATLDSVDRALAASRRFLLLGTAAAVAFAVLLAGSVTYRVTRPIRDLTRTALRMSDGDLDVRAEADGEAEVAKLGRALNRMASELSSTIDQLVTERDRLAGILEGMGEGVLVIDAEGSITLANRALRTMAGIGEDAIGQSALSALRNVDLKEALDAAAERDGPLTCEIELGRLLPRRLLVRISRHGRADSKRPEGLIAVFHDVTDLRRLETIRTDFVANVSHELRTPVTAISTSAETLLAGALSDPSEAADFVDVIERHAKRLRQLLDDLLDLSKMEAKTFRLSPIELELGGVLDHAALLMAEPARRRNVELRVEKPALPLRARADRRALEQVLMNLLDNAIKYAGEGARVELVACTLDGRPAVVVRDNGAGIAAVHLGRIFERFYRVDAGRSREMGGTGLGLSIVKHLVESMGAAVEVESEPGRGSTFTLRFRRPASDPNGARPREE
jgi:two-component system, OmpR family, phosphate regulon sensor histidine kinase PhoR